LRKLLFLQLSLFPLQASDSADTLRKQIQKMRNSPMSPLAGGVVVISTACPHCNQKMQAPENLVNRQVKCPVCKKPFAVRGPVASIATAAAPTSPFPSFEQRPSKGWRFISLPWLITVLLFGFLPWCEVSCQKSEIRLTQSGYQAVYGDVSLPPAVDDALAKQAERHPPTKEQLGFERSYLANVSPFLIFFWIACVSLIVIVCSVPLGGLRLGLTLPLAGIMLSRTAKIIAQSVREPEVPRMDARCNQGFQIGQG
jgi:hypothetical protein